jgi:hypothetical protein
LLFSFWLLENFVTHFSEEPALRPSKRCSLRVALLDLAHDGEIQGHTNVPQNRQVTTTIGKVHFIAWPTRVFLISQGQ